MKSNRKIKKRGKTTNVLASFLEVKYHPIWNDEDSDKLWPWWWWPWWWLPTCGMSSGNWEVFSILSPWLSPANDIRKIILRNGAIFEICKWIVIHHSNEKLLTFHAGQTELSENNDGGNWKYDFYWKIVRTRISQNMLHNHLTNLHCCQHCQPTFFWRKIIWTVFFLVNLLSPCKQLATGSERRNKKVTLNRDQISGHLTRLSCPLDQEEKTGPGTHTGHRVPPPCVACQVGACLCHTRCPLCDTGQPPVLSRCLVSCKGGMVVTTTIPRRGARWVL